MKVVTCQWQRNIKRFPPYPFIKTAVIAIIIFSFSGCSTASWVISPPPHVETLYVTENDVIAYMDRLSQMDGDPDAVLYNPETDRYEMRADVYKRALTKSIMYEIQTEKIDEFAGDYERETFGKAFKKDLTSIGIGGILLLIGLTVVGAL